jgi:hypothetical protein
MPEMSIAELALMSRALERAMNKIPNKPRTDVTTKDLSLAILTAANEGIRDEESLASRALETVGLEEVT